MQPPIPAILILEDGQTFTGHSFGAHGEIFGKTVIDTGMSGYQEYLTDPARSGQIVVATAPHIGNTGWNDEDSCSERIQAAGFVVRDPSPRPSSWRSRRSLDEAMAADGVVGIAGIDTRALTLHIRDHGPLRAGISTTDLDRESLLDKVRRYGAGED